jgi:hypothetical protein
MDELGGEGDREACLLGTESEEMSIASALAEGPQTLKEQRNLL